MPVKRRTSKHRGAIQDFEAAWLVGNEKDTYVFMYSLSHGFVHRELWDKHGDHENFFWEEGMQYPVPIDELEETE